MIDWSSCSAVERDVEKVSGSWVFRNTRVPVIALFENLEGGASIDDFLLWFPVCYEGTSGGCPRIHHPESESRPSGGVTMKLLFDQGTPVPLRNHLPNHIVETAHEKGWSNLKNGDLLTHAEVHGFDALTWPEPTAPI
jgi:hypothetical protein